MRRLSRITVLATLGLVVGLPAAAQAKPAFTATANHNGVCTILVTAWWSGARVNGLDFKLSTNAAAYDSHAIALAGPATSGMLQYTFTTTSADTSGYGVVDFLGKNGRVVRSAKTDPTEIVCA